MLINFNLHINLQFRRGFHNIYYSSKSKWMYISTHLRHPNPLLNSKSSSLEMAESEKPRSWKGTSQENLKKNILPPKVLKWAQLSSTQTMGLWDFQFGTLPDRKNLEDWEKDTTLELILLSSCSMWQLESHTRTSLNGTRISPESVKTFQLCWLGTKWTKRTEKWRPARSPSIESETSSILTFLQNRTTSTKSLSFGFCEHLLEMQICIWLKP